MQVLATTTRTQGSAASSLDDKLGEMQHAFHQLQRWNKRLKKTLI